MVDWRVEEAGYGIWVPLGGGLEKRAVEKVRHSCGHEISENECMGLKMDSGD